MISNKIFLPLILVLLISSCIHETKEAVKTVESIKNEGWKEVLDGQIKLLGHRNWIVVVDEAYPLQSNPGITTILSDAGHLETLEYVANLIDNQQHIKPIIYIDKEIDFLEEKAAKGITDFRNSLSEILDENNAKRLIHEDIISKLDEAADQFNILIIKTDFAIPYTSVFFQLDCKYWNAESEEMLRKRIAETEEVNQ